ncbi:hypothetical protein D3C86_1973270 [compost metagenome]
MEVMDGETGHRVTEQSHTHGNTRGWVENTRPGMLGHVVGKVDIVESEIVVPQAQPFRPVTRPCVANCKIHVTHLLCLEESSSRLSASD